MQTITHLLGRQVQEISKVPASKMNISVLQWNALARCYCTERHYPLLPQEAVDFDQRKHLISQELTSLNPDIICLQEVDKKDTSFYRSIYPEEDYSFSYVKKPHSADGTCIMTRKKAFEIIETEIVEHFDPEKDRKENLISQIVVAKHKDTELETYLIIATCHLKAATLEASFEATRLRQAKQLIEAIEKKRHKCLELLGGKQENLAVLVCGDFNTQPGTAPAEEFLKHIDFGLKSVFHDEEYTLFQMFGNRQYTLKKVIDFVMHSGNLVLTKRLGPPEEGKVGEDGLLSEVFPSDHLSLFCELAFPVSKE